MKIYRLAKIFILIFLAFISAIALLHFKSPDEKRGNFCSSFKALNQTPVKHYDMNGIKWRQGTFNTKVFLNEQREIKVIIFPQALSPKIWSEVPQASIQYIGNGGDNNWREWLSPDYFYLLTVPPQTTALAFGRLCNRNGDVEVEPIKKLEKISDTKIIINNKIYLSVSSPVPTINQYSVIVNTGSNRLDTLGIQTEVYFTKEKLKYE
ncbi:MAG: hypothetical protein RMX96_30570 [Nostoc sp. ChiSLP02]|nr:hypothetical protein [Nostoc sp. DedSLP05]MDZ8097323.1 hypothetical protein [Nostoc sp. DedSLP01]MDZ8189171.1 hypothetical protein [Nostoc sp. ChiSLP02]